MQVPARRPVGGRGAQRAAKAAACRACGARAGRRGSLKPDRRESLPADPAWERARLPSGSGGTSAPRPGCCAHGRVPRAHPCAQGPRPCAQHSGRGCYSWGAEAVIPGAPRMAFPRRPGFPWRAQGLCLGRPGFLLLGRPGFFVPGAPRVTAQRAWGNSPRKFDAPSGHALRSYSALSWSTLRLTKMPRFRAEGPYHKAPPPTGPPVPRAPTIRQG